MTRLRLRLLIGLVVAAALAFSASPDIRAAAKAGAKATAKAAAKAATTATAAVTAAAPQSKSKTQQPASTACTVNGKTFQNCPPALQKQAARQAARQHAAPQKTGVALRFGGISPASAGRSPLAQVGTGPTTLATMAASGTPPDYFGVANYANSPLPVIDPTTGAVTGGMRKFVDDLPQFCTPGTTNGGATALGQCIPIATPDTVTFPGTDFYRIGLKEFNKQMHSDLPGPANLANPGAGTALRGYIQLDSTNSAAASTPQYLGPVIVATRNKPVRLLFSNQLTTNLNVPVDTTYMGAGDVSDGTNSVLTTSEKRSVVHLHGGNTPWISDGTPHQWITPSGGDGQPAATGFQKGFSFQNVPDMVGAGSPLSELASPNVSDGLGTYYFTNQQSGRLMFYHEHAYGTTRLGVYNGIAAGYLLVDPTQESMLKTATVPGTISNPANLLDTVNDLGHVLPLVIQDKTFVPDAGLAGGQLAAEDPTWDLTRGGYGDLWFPHVYMPNQNPADITGANGFGRWDYGPWFWPPQNPSTFVAGGQPYQCTSIAYPGGAGLAYPPLMCPGTPLPSGTPESFMDTPVVNGTAYPALTVDPTAYRFQVLNAANDRSLNLGLYTAEPVTLSAVILSPGAGYVSPVVTIDQTTCTGGQAIATIGDGVGFTAGIVGITMVSQPSACTGTPAITITDAAATSSASAVAVMATNSDVKMVQAIPATAGRALPNCSTKLPMAGGGQVTALLDGSGNPVNGTGLPLNCWPLYSSAQGYTAGTFGENGGQLSWGNSDARIGGVPDPTTAGPPIVQLGAEGGVLPQVTVIPSTPVSFDYNKRSITVLNVLNHGLWLGPAERADIVIDFSKFAGQTLIVYNDAPAPVPAGDPRIDYYTNDPDQTASGGAPSTLAGYGPNTRTVMKITVRSSAVNPLPSTAFSVGALLSPTTGLPAIFAATQELPIVPEPAYPTGYGNGPATYIPIQNTSVTAWVGGPIGALTLTSGGAGYTGTPSVTISPCSGSNCTTATATAAIAPTSVASFTLTNGGSGYTSAPAVTVTNGGGSGAAATAVLSTRGVASVTITNGGNGYTSLPTVTFSAPLSGTRATGTAVVSNRKVIGVTITNPGSGYTAAPTVTFTGGGGSSAAGTAVLAPTSVATINLTASGSGYTSAPTVTIATPQTTGTRATAVANLTPTVVASVTLTNPGTGYNSAPTVTFSAPQTAGSTATAVAIAPTVPLLPKTIQELFTLDYGRMNATLGVELPFTNFTTQTTIPYGYSDPPTEIFKDGETQLWKITHNGVDTHFIHFHLFTVQVINRVGWDGAIKPPDPYELGMKDTVRMNPLEDIVVALRPFKQTLPFAVPNSNRPMDVTHPVGYQSTTTFTNIDPANNPATVSNDKINFGWEYVWHCHILGHEENDMMRAMVLAVAPTAPTVSGLSPAKGTVKLSISASATPSTAVPSGFTVQRGTSASGPWTTLGAVAATVSGTTATATFTDTGLKSKSTVYYRVVSNNVVGYTQVYATGGYPNTSADSAPAFSAGVIVQ